MLEPTMKSREHILVFGNGGTGKTNAILKLAERNSDVKFWAINTDGRMNALLERGFPELGNVSVVELGISDWENWISGVEKIASEMGRDDWMVLDLIGPSWTAIQHWFVRETAGMSFNEYVMELKKARKAAGKGDGGTISMADWGVINPEYQRLWGLLRGANGHVYGTAEVKQIGDDTGAMIKNTYGAYGVYPKGNSFLYHNFDDILLFKKNRVGEYTMTSVKTTGREEFEDVPVGDWSKSYLRRYAGWVEKE